MKDIATKSTTNYILEKYDLYPKKKYGQNFLKDKNILENSQKDEFLYSYNQEVHEGIVGLIAGKYTHEFQKPSFVMKYDEKNEWGMHCGKGKSGVSNHISVSIC